MTERNDIETRLSELNSPPNIPLSYRCYATYEVDNPRDVELHIHRLIDLVDDSLHAREQLTNGRIREREFFKISPEKAFNIFKNIAGLRGDLHMLKLYTPTANQVLEQEIAENNTRRSSNSFELLNISIAEKITFLFDDTIAAEVMDNKNKIKFEGIEYSVSGLASKLLVEKCGWKEGTRVNGWMYFTWDGKVLSDLRDIIESREEI